MALQEELTRALEKGQTQPINERTQCAMAGMVAALDQYQTNSKADYRSRSWDGLGTIDTAVTRLKSDWTVARAVSGTTQDLIANLLSACRTWLAGPNPAASRIPSIRTLYWKVGWCYSAARFIIAARGAIVANGSRNVTTLVDGKLSNLATGNPYDFRNCGYTKVTPAGRLYRGDTRTPQDVLSAKGFVSASYQDLEQFKPWWDGHSLGTQSTTANEELACNAVLASKAYRPGALPQWLPDLLPGKRMRGFVYEFDPRQAPGLILPNEPREISYLAIPFACITRFWVVTHDRATAGPFSFPITPRLHPSDAATWAWSDRQLSLARPRPLVKRAC